MSDLYPDEAQSQIKPFCAPRPDCGFEVEVIPNLTDDRAGIAAAADAAPGPLKGWIETMDGGAIRGVCSNEGSAAPVVLELVVDGAVIGQVLANHARPARVADGLNERCGFQLKLPGGLSPYARHTVSVRRASDKADLAGSPFMMEAATKLTDMGRHTLTVALENAVASSGSVAEIDRALVFLAARTEALLQAKADLAGRRAERTAPLVGPGWSKQSASVAALDGEAA